MKTVNKFFGASMDKDSDIRILKPVDYIHASNLDVATSTEGMGKITEDLGTVLEVPAVDAGDEVIGTFSDTKKDAIYCFVKGITTHKVLEVTKDGYSTVISGSSLFFSGEINSVVKVYNEDTTKDLLIWTDDINPIRYINIERAKTYAPDGFIESQISLLKEPPKDAPKLVPISGGDSNRIKEQFLSFAYRSKFIDGEYSALSPFSNAAFLPNDFDFNSANLTNDGMVNSYSSVEVTVNTGGINVKEVEVVAKNTLSNTAYIIGTIDKEEKGLSDDQEYTIDFDNSGIYKAIPESQIYRIYDNVPLKAKTLTLAGNRIVTANYLEGRDIKDADGGSNIAISVEPSVLYGGEEVSNDSVIEAEFSDKVDYEDLYDTFALNMSQAVITPEQGGGIVKDQRINMKLVCKPKLIADPSESPEGSYILETIFYYQNEYANIQDFYNNSGIISFIESAMSSAMVPEGGDISWDGKYDSATEEVYVQTAKSELNQGFVAGLQGNLITIKALTVRNLNVYLPSDLNTPVPKTATAYFDGNLTTVDPINSLENGVAVKSLKSNRTISVGIVYKDDQGRATPVFAGDKDSTFVQPKASVSGASLRVRVANKAPYWATHYNIAVKQAALSYQTIYIIDYLIGDDGFLYAKLEGDNLSKVKQEDTLIVKNDFSGPVRSLKEVKVLDVASYTGEVVSKGGEDITLSGKYMKVRASEFNAGEGMYYQDYSGYSSGTKEVRCEALPKQDDNIPIDSTVKVEMSIKDTAPDGLTQTFDKTYITSVNYQTFEDLYNGTGMLGTDQDFMFFKNSYLSSDGFDSGKYYIVPSAVGTLQYPIEVSLKISANAGNGILTFETKDIVEEPVDLYYELGETFDITTQGGFSYHSGNSQSQTSSQEAILDLDFWNCFAYGNGVESYRIRDAVAAPFYNRDVRVMSTIDGEYASVRRYADFTYGETYNEGSGINRLNEFNPYNLNYKDDIEKSYGPVEFIYARDTDILVWQRDKVSKVLFGKDLLSTAAGNASVTKVPYILGQQVDYRGDYGTRDPRSIAFVGNRVYWLDRERNKILRLAADGINDITTGINSWLRDRVEEGITSCLGFVDPVSKRYIVNININTTGDQYTLKFDEFSFSMNRKGWVSFYSLYPEAMATLEGALYSMNAGAIYSHTDKVNRNVYYGNYYPASIEIPCIPNPEGVYTFKSLHIKGSHKMSGRMNYFLNNTSEQNYVDIREAEFEDNEGILKTYLRRSTTKGSSESVYGIGVVVGATSGGVLTFSSVDYSKISEGDVLIDSSGNVIGSIEGGESDYLYVPDADPSLIGQFVAGQRNQRVYGEQPRGFGSTISLTAGSLQGQGFELYCVEVEAKPSTT